MGSVVMAETGSTAPCAAAEQAEPEPLQSVEVHVRPLSITDACEGAGDCPWQRPAQTLGGARAAGPRQKQRAVVKRPVVRAETLPAVSSASMPSVYVRPQLRPVNDHVVPDVDPT